MVSKFLAYVFHLISFFVSSSQVVSVSGYIAMSCSICIFQYCAFSMNIQEVAAAEFALRYLFLH